MTMINDTTPRTVAGRITGARRMAGLDQSQLAESLGVARSTLANWEQGRTEPSLSAFVRLSRITGQSLDWFAEGVARPEGFEPPTF